MSYKLSYASMKGGTSGGTHVNGMLKPRTNVARGALSSDTVRMRTKLSANAEVVYTSEIGKKT